MYLYIIYISITTRSAWGSLMQACPNNILYNYISYDGVKLQRKMMGYITAIFPRVVYNPLMFYILPRSG